MTASVRYTLQQQNLFATAKTSAATKPAAATCNCHTGANKPAA